MVDYLSPEWDNSTQEIIMDNIYWNGRDFWQAKTLLVPYLTLWELI